MNSAHSFTEGSENNMSAAVITCTFIDGPLQGQQIAVDLEKHNHTDRKTGAYYVRETVTRDGALVSYFRLNTRKHETRTKT